MSNVRQKLLLIIVKAVGKVEIYTWNWYKAGPKKHIGKWKDLHDVSQKRRKEWKTFVYASFTCHNLITMVYESKIQVCVNDKPAANLTFDVVFSICGIGALVVDNHRVVTKGEVGQNSKLYLPSSLLNRNNNQIRH